MQYAIMRNNIYSLKIGTFKEIGSSTIIPEDGGTIDDESAYLKLTTTIAPWIVRFNTVNFKLITLLYKQERSVPPLPLFSLNILTLKKQKHENSKNIRPTTLFQPNDGDDIGKSHCVVRQHTRRRRC